MSFECLPWSFPDRVILEKAEALAKYPDLHNLDTCRMIVYMQQELRKEVYKASEGGVLIPSPQFPAKKFEKLLQSQLKSFAAVVFLPDSETTERMKVRRELRKRTLAVLDQIQAPMNQEKGGGLWISPNPLAIIEWSV
jgi:hypothetical protein